MPEVQNHHVCDPGSPQTVSGTRAHLLVADADVAELLSRYHLVLLRGQVLDGQRQPAVLGLGNAHADGKFIAMTGKLTDV